MKNLFQGIAIGIFITIVGLYTGVFKTSSIATATENSQLKKLVIMEAGLLNGLPAFDADRRPNGTGNVIPTEPLTDLEACIRVGAYQKAAGGKYGLFLTKTLIEEMFAGHSNNGLWIFLGKHTDQGNSIETNFIVKSATEDYTTEPIEGAGYRLVGALCPSYCDGMDLTKCK